MKDGKIEPRSQGENPWPMNTTAPICGSKGGSDQLRDTVDTKDDRGEAARDYREEKGRCDGVFHRCPQGKIHISGVERLRGVNRRQSLPY
jgi:hypothetical protein